MDQPPVKRARTSSVLPSVSANDALIFVVVNGGSESLVELARFRPDFSHQIFGQEEEIKGYTNLTVTVNLSAWSLHAFVQIRYTLGDVRV